MIKWRAADGIQLKVGSCWRIIVNFLEYSFIWDWAEWVWDIENIRLFIWADFPARPCFWVRSYTWPTMANIRIPEREGELPSISKELSCHLSALHGIYKWNWNNHTFSTLLIWKLKNLDHFLICFPAEGWKLLFEYTYTMSLFLIGDSMCFVWFSKCGIAVPWGKREYGKTKNSTNSNKKRRISTTEYV